MMLAAARCQHRDDVFEGGAADVWDEGLHAGVACPGPCRTSHALLQTGRDPRQVQVREAGRGLQVMALLPDAAQAQNRVLAGAEALLEAHARTPGL